MDSILCDNCLYNAYDEEYECFVCMMQLDEDEMYRLVNNSYKDCPYFKNGDEYSIVRKQN